MKIAFLIVAHNNFEHVEKMAQALNFPGATCFVHVDKRVEAVFKPESNIIQVKDRYVVQWAGYSLVAATLSLMKTAAAHDRYDYFCLLSGADYPIRPMWELQQYLSERGSEFINIAAFGEMGKSIERVLIAYDENGGMRNTGLRSKVARLQNKVNRVLYRKFGIARKLPDGFKISDFRAGSQWFCLSGQAVDRILAFLQQHPHFVEFCKKSSFSDEFFFQTVLHKCGYDGRIEPNLHYTDWTKGPPPYPSVISELHLEDLARGTIDADGYGPKRQAFFARKFAPSSSNVIGILDRHLARAPGSEVTAD